MVAEFIDFGSWTKAKDCDETTNQKLTSSRKVSRRAGERSVNGPGENVTGCGN